MKEKTAKARVLECIIEGVTDRAEIAKRCGITYMQCHSQIRHLQNEGKIYKASPQIFKGFNGKGGSSPATYKPTASGRDGVSVVLEVAPMFYRVASIFRVGVQA